MSSRIEAGIRADKNGDDGMPATSGEKGRTGDRSRTPTRVDGNLMSWDALTLTGLRTYSPRTLCPAVVLPDLFNVFCGPSRSPPPPPHNVHGCAEGNVHDDMNMQCAFVWFAALPKACPFTASCTLIVVSLVLVVRWTIHCPPPPLPELRGSIQTTHPKNNFPALLALELLRYPSAGGGSTPSPF